ncbi:hypothetical protein XarjCFBP7653_15525 [Xanthomonas arboricola]|nr:hypothetical protein XarjCFBP7653_15525 [Xanthomonas arboricola]
MCVPTYPHPPFGHLLAVGEGRRWENGASASPAGARGHGLRATGARALERPRRKRGPGPERGLG